MTHYKEAQYLSELSPQEKGKLAKEIYDHLSKDLEELNAQQPLKPVIKGAKRFATRPQGRVILVYSKGLS